MRLAFLLLLFGIVIAKDFGYKKVKWGDKKHDPHPALHKAMSKTQAAALPSNAVMTIGTLFVFSYINSHLSKTDTSYTEYLFLTVTNPGAQDATVKISSVFANFNNQTVVVKANTTQVYSITPVSIQVDYMDAQSVAGTTSFREYKSIWVQSDQPVKLVATNQLSDGSGEDKFTVIPVCQLGKNYMAVVDESSVIKDSPQATNIVTVIATQDGTIVNYYGTLLPASLKKGQQYTVVTTRPHSGIPLTSNYPVAVVTGAVCGYGVWTQPQIHCSHEALMLYPVQSFDTIFPYYKFLPEDFGEAMIYVQYNQTRIYANNQLLGILDSDEFFILKIYNGIYFTANQPIYVVGVGTINTQDQGSPFFAHIPSPSLFTTGPVIFATAITDDEKNNMVHYARIETELNNIGSIAVDSYYPNGLLYKRMGASTYYFVDVKISSGEHRVYSNNPNITFAVTIYGYGFLRSYAFNPALNLPSIGTC